MKTIGMLIISAAMALCGATAAFSEEVVLRYSNWLPPTFFMNEQALFKYFDDIETVTEGRVKVEISASPYAPPPRNYQITVDGVADLGWGLHGYTPGTFPLSELVELPRNSTNVVADSVAYWRVFEKFFEPAGMHPGVHTLAVHVQPAGQIYNSVRPIKTGDDFNGLKLRVPNSGVSDALTRLGATPVGLPVTAMHEALSKGIVDGVAAPEEGLVGFRVTNLVKYELEVPGGLFNSSMFLVMNEDKWKRISPEDQAAITGISGEVLARRIATVWQVGQDKAVEAIAAAGIEVDKPGDELLGFIDERLGDFEAAWIEKANKAGVDGAAALAMYRAEQKALN